MVGIGSGPLLAKIGSVALVGTEARVVDVEVDVTAGLPRFSTVGLPARSVREAEQRTRSALASVGERWPAARIVANLAPGALPKEGTHFDLPIALGILAGAERIAARALEGWIAIGELGLDGALRPARGALAAALACRGAGRKGVICPRRNGGEVALVDGVEVVAVATLGECLEWLRGELVAAPRPAAAAPPAQAADDLRDVCGHAVAKRALEIAAAGAHNLLLTGPPGSGKTMLARRLPGVLPALTSEESLEVTRILSVAGLLPEGTGLVTRRPFRAPHHNVSLAGLVGGGSGLARPGEVSLAHHGVLFLDELTLYRRDVLEALRGPLEDGVVRIARSGGAIAYPCRFALVAAMNPCPCGYLGDARRACACSARQIQAYRARLSGPLLDRFDLHVTMARPERRELLAEPAGEPTSAVRGRVERARAAQAERYGSTAETNSSAPGAGLARGAPPTPGARAIVELAADSLGLSGRGLDRVLRVARTIADLAGSAEVGEAHVAEALSYRVGDRHGEVAA